MRPTRERICEVAAVEDRRKILSVKDLVVKFHVRGRILTAIRGISLDIYENESIAIVGESGCGKSVFTKTFAGMLDDNGFIDNGKIIYNDPELSDTRAPLNDEARRMIASSAAKLDEYSKLEVGGNLFREITKLKEEKISITELTKEEAKAYDDKLGELVYDRTQLFNLKQTFDTKNEKDKIREAAAKLKEYDAQIKTLQDEKKKASDAKKARVMAEANAFKEIDEKIAGLEKEYAEAIKADISEDTRKRNEILAKEIYLSIARYPRGKRVKYTGQLLDEFKKAMQKGDDLSDETVLNDLFDNVVFRVAYVDETADTLHGECILNLAKFRLKKDWAKIRGERIATVFQDPMTSLNPILTIGEQITSIILKHQDCSEVEARQRAMVMMKKVGIPNAEDRFGDYPFQYSGGMRQRIVIAIALSCQPKILICDEPTTALDVTIQAQILRLLKSLQKELNFTIVFITHDLGVVANIADRVAVLYAGQIVELGKVDEVFYDPRHPYTWALLSSLPQLVQRNTKLYSITGTPPSLYNQIVGDPFAPRNPYCMKIDTVKEPPMFKITDTHYAKTWLLDERAPEVQKPEIIENIHEKLIQAFNI
ncbi:MAG: ATP-binding cassette domain-containing protein [Lachnospiraceae bacterium]|nr:ATP-binding cassette domain-containing protein [Lachnospiraceae bacterium]